MSNPITGAIPNNSGKFVIGRDTMRSDWQYFHGLIGNSTHSRKFVIRRDTAGSDWLEIETIASNAIRSRSVNSFEF